VGGREGSSIETSWPLWRLAGTCPWVVQSGKEGGSEGGREGVT